MIERVEVMELTSAWSLSAGVVEKDYVLGWLLAGIQNQAELATEWVFKGGTCLKKCFFETYRFSEDLDFTVRSGFVFDETRLKTVLERVGAWVYDQTGIEIPTTDTRVELFRNPRGSLSAQVRLYYQGPLRRQRGGRQKVKLDLTQDEIIVRKPVLRQIDHPYSDCPDSGLVVGCYAFEEVFAEKIRALIERCRPRDLYDVVQLFWRDESVGLADEVRSVLDRKCAHKGLEIPPVEALDRFRPELETEWANMLAHQLPGLPPVDQFWKELGAVFRWLHGQDSRPVLKPIAIIQGAPLDSTDEVLPTHARRNREVLRLIQFAAASRLCVDLRFQDSTERIEPYALRKARDGRVLLAAVRSTDGETTSCPMEQIQKLSISNQAFDPKYTVEIAKTRKELVPPNTMP